MRGAVLVLVALTLLILGVVIFRYRMGINTLRVDPHASEEIEKAKQR